jgi:hypothetical protein
MTTKLAKLRENEGVENVDPDTCKVDLGIHPNLLNFVNFVPFVVPNPVFGLSAPEDARWIV